MTISDCKTVEEVESLACYECSVTGQLGWCDASHIKCEYKNRIKEILGETESRYTARKYIMEERINDKTYSTTYATGKRR